MAPPHSGYSSTEIWIELEFGNVCFLCVQNRDVPLTPAAIVLAWRCFFLSA